jgi:Laminin B (Domain IV)
VGKGWRLFVVLAAVLACPVAADAATVASRFDSGTEGWTVSGDPSGPPQFVASGGHPGGFIRVVDGSGGVSMYWVAPAKFRRVGGLYGGFLRFDLRQSSQTNQYDDPDVVIVGGGLTVAYDTASNPTNSFTSFTVPLRERPQWTNVQTKKRATQAEMQKVLSAPTAIRIRAEYVTGPDTDDLDNVVLTTGDSVPPPVAGKSVVASVVSGVVFVQVPSGKSIRRGKGSSSRAYAAKFRRYRGKANIPVGSTVDTRRGRIAITSAADLKGATQSADFYDGVFQIKQKRQADLITDAQLVTSRAKCGSGARASRSRRLGRLWATGKGRFRTKGRYSAASVRGTTWLTEERCDGTLTKVSRGRVAVRDTVKRKTVLLTAGQSYFARAQRATSRG